MKRYTLQKKILRFLYSSLFIVSLNLFFNCAYSVESKRGLDGFKHNVLNPMKNARVHANMGNVHFAEKKYIAALKEYEIAYNLAYNTQAAGSYLYNIARCFYVMQNYPLAKNAIEGAIKKDCINITYYQMLIDCYLKLGTVEQELNKHLKDTTNPYNQVVAGLIYLKTDRKMEAKATLDDFVVKNPDMIITDDVRVILNNI